MGRVQVSFSSWGDETSPLFPLDFFIPAGHFYVTRDVFMGQTGGQELVSHGISSFSSLLESLGVLFPGIANAELNYITSNKWHFHGETTSYLTLAIPLPSRS
jgi:hypothetical protein